MSERPRKSTTSRSRGKRAALQQDPVIDVDMTGDDHILPPWPRDSVPFDISGVIPRPASEVSKTSEYINRPFNEHWDHFDSMDYNGLLAIKFKPSKLLDLQILRKVGLDEELMEMMGTVGLGNIAVRHYPLYGEYVRQCLASCRVEFRVPFDKKARDGEFTFKVNGKKYRISFRDMCGLYGFDKDNEEILLPTEWSDARAFWSMIAKGHWCSGSSSHTDIGHPILRLFVKILRHTIHCSMEVNKVRVPQLILLWYAIGDRFPQYQGTHAPHQINLGSVFAHHLCTLRERGYVHRGKMEEFVGSFLTPIFQHVHIPLPAEMADTSTRGIFMDERHLRSAVFLKTHPDAPNKFYYIWHTLQGKRYLPLPSAYASIATEEDLRFDVPLHECDRFDLRETQRRQGDATAPEASRGAPSSSAADLGEFEMPPADIYEDPPRLGRFIVETLGGLVGAVRQIQGTLREMRESCRCSRPSEVVPPHPQYPHAMAHDAQAGGSRGQTRPRSRSQSQSDSDDA